jgi:type IV secretory pathway TraG/TraD family ATPase VirD4
MKFFRYLLIFNAVRLWLSHRNLRQENAGRFLSDKEVKELLSPKNHGLVMDGARGKLSPDDSFRNVAIVATTGAGKTSSFILPNLLSLNNCSIVATDPSGALRGCNPKTAESLTFCIC